MSAHSSADGYLTSASIPVIGAEAGEAVASLKRRASPSFEEASTSYKKLREHSVDRDESVRPYGAPVDDPRMPRDDQVAESPKVDGRALADDMESELECGICSALAYKPVVVNPCQHFFCGSCCHLWIKNGGTNCPACRGVSTTAVPSRALQTMIDVLLRNCPSKRRSEREREQADEVYKAGTTLRIPMPAPSSPPPQIPTNDSLARPCPHCHPDNPYGYRCLQPIPDPDAHPNQAWNLDNGPPPGHAFCGNCEDLLALRAPATTNCDFCEVSFCGIGVQGRCIAARIENAQPQGFADVSDLIQSIELYECFDSNSVEVEILLDYLVTKRLRPQAIYRDIVLYIQSQPRGFSSLIELGLFSENGHGEATGVNNDPSHPRTRICRVCAAEVLMWGIRDWWIRERRKGHVDPGVLSRRDCPEGSACERQKDTVHAKEYNHIFAHPIADPEQQLPVIPAHPPHMDDLRDFTLPPAVAAASSGGAAIFANLSRDWHGRAPRGSSPPFPDGVGLPSQW